MWVRALVAGLALALLAGCGGGGGAPFPADGRAPAGGGGRLLYAVPNGFGNLDPIHARSFSAQVVARQLFEPLVARLRGPYSAGMRPRAGLALGWSHSRDSRVWSFRLRPGVRFQDGTPLDANAVAANAERWLSDGEGRRLLPGLAAAAAPRPNVVRLILADPLPGLPARLADPRLGVVSPPALAPESGVGARFVGAREAGSGPFELRGRVAAVAVLSRNRRWWGSALALGPALDEIIFRVVPEAVSRERLLRDGAVRVAAGLDPRRAALLTRDPLLSAVGPGGGSAGGERGSGSSAGGDWVAFERSVRGIGSARPLPLSGVWTALLSGSG